MDDELKILKQARSILPGRPTVGTIRKWIRVGIRVRGRRIRLKCVKLGGRYFVTHESCLEFMKELTRAAVP